MLYQLKNVDFDYDDTTCLSQIDLQIEDNSISAFVGPNGAGKSTLLNLLAFLELPTRGEFSFLSTRLNALNQDKLRKNIAFVQQNPYLLRGSVFFNVEIGLKLRRVNQVNRLQKVNSVINMLNIEHLITRNINTLSGGETQKVAIARALVLEPEVMILDEPFTFLDKSSIDDLEKLICRLKTELNKTIIFTTHNQIQAQSLANDVYSIVNGRCFSAEYINLFSGKYIDDLQQFDTGNLKITLANKSKKQINQIAIDSNQIVLSKEKLESSMQNNFPGTVKAMSEHDGLVTVTIHAGEEFKVLISENALHELGLSISDHIWLSFKSAAILLC